MMPLCTPTTSDSTAPLPDPEQLPLTWGCALITLGSPCVAHRVCPIPQHPASARPWSVLSARWYSFPVALTTSASSVPLRTARPAESYPRYSSRERLSSRIGAACCRPVNPTIPHICCPSVIQIKNRKMSCTADPIVLYLWILPSRLLFVNTL